MHQPLLAGVPWKRSLLLSKAWASEKSQTWESRSMSINFKAEPGKLHLSGGNDTFIVDTWDAKVTRAPKPPSDDDLPKPPKRSLLMVAAKLYGLWNFIKKVFDTLVPPAFRARAPQA
jgi:hypothetical protein